MTITLSPPAIRARCDVVGSCWLWRGSLNSGGCPTARHDNQTVNVRRLVLALARGCEPCALTRVVVPSCGNKRCVSPLCLEDLSRSRHLTVCARTNPAWARDPERLTRSRLKGSRVGYEGARAMRADPRPAAAVAADWQCSSSLVRQIRRGMIWREPVEPAPVPRVVAAPPSRYEPAGSFDRTITADWMLRRQGVSIPSRMAGYFKERI